jgi:hypothetical protein
MAIALPWAHQLATGNALTLRPDERLRQWRDSRNIESRRGTRTVRLNC